MTTLLYILYQMFNILSEPLTTATPMPMEILKCVEKEWRIHFQPLLLEFIEGSQQMKNESSFTL